MGSKYAFIAIWILILLVLLFFHTRGIFYSDDGYILYSAKRVLQGQIPYKDFHFAYTPLSIFITVLGFNLFGVSILASRLTALIVSLVALIILYKLARLLRGGIYLSFIPAFVYLAWGPTHVNFVWPVMISLLFGILNCWLLLKAFHAKKTIYLFWAGFTTLVAILSKPNFGAGMVFNMVLFFIFARDFRKTKFVFYTIAGFITASSIFFLYLLTTGSLLAFYTDFYEYTIKRIIFERALDTSYLYHSGFLWTLGKIVIYICPLIFSLFTLIFVKKRNYFFLNTFVLLFYILGIRPTTDYVHLVPLLAISAIPIFLLIQYSRYKKVFLLLSALLVGLGFYTALFKGYYNWEAPLIDQKYFIDHPKVNIWGFSSHKYEIQKISAYVGAHTQKGDYIFVNEYEPMVYFFADRNNPTKFDIVDFSSFYAPYKSEIIKNLQNKNVVIIITHYNWEGSYISDFIQRHYKPIQKIHGFLIWEKKI